MKKSSNIRHLLVIEDDRGTRVMLSSILTEVGYRVTAASSGEQGYQILKDDPSIELLLCDWMLPDTSGIEIVKRLRSELAERNIYCILVTGKSESSDVAEGLSLGADAYLKKPIHREELIAFLQAGVRIVELQNSLIAKQRQIEGVHKQTSRLLASIPSFYMAVDKNDVVCNWNSSAEKVFGLKAEEVIGRNFLKLGLSFDWQTLLEAIATARDEERDVRLEEIPYQIPEGKLLYIDLAVCPLRGDSSEEQRVLLIGEDVTNRVTIAQQLQQSQKLESLGQLASGLAHEINSPMQFIADNVRFVRDSVRKMFPLLSFLEERHRNVPLNECISLSEDERFKIEAAKIGFFLAECDPTIGQTLEGIDRINGIIKAMKEFSHPGGSSPVAGDINRIIENAITISRNEWRSVATIIREYDETIPQINCYPAELGQAVLNIVVNAAHAIADKKKGMGQITVRTCQRNNRYAIEIKDTGGGIPKEIAHRVFDPFFTTKEVGRGTGQGLSITHSAITKLHKGSLHFESEVGEGTTFIIEIDDLKNQQKNESQEIRGE